jgi:serine/threonine protein kinase
MPEIGQTLSHYRILQKIGVGGMGEVYLADDTTLDRKVALKFLPEVFTNDPERMARFEREAKLLASLNHPNIAGIYGLEQADGNRFLVLEYVEGQTLQARLNKGALPLDDALTICRQIAEGLEAAHEKGVIHRDLKPGNVMITADEKVKILDFGLAKALADEGQRVDPSDSPTITEAMTQPGVVLGTAAYMSPEQAKSKSVDKRADIWAFGCILYECLTGKRAFEGETVTETLAAILRGDPDWNLLPSSTPQNIRFVLRRCLEKEKGRRFRDAADANILLEEPITPATAHKNILSRILPAYIAILIILSLIVGSGITYIWHISAKNSFLKGEPIITHIAAPKEAITAFSKGFALSPDGRTLIFSARTKDGRHQLWKRRLDKTLAEPMAGTEDGTYPFWSPDGRRVGFFVPGALRCIPADGGQVVTICILSSDINHSGAWGDSGNVLFQGRQGSRSIIVYVSEEGGNPIPVPGLGGGDAFAPQWLPGGRQFLFSRSEGNDSASIWAASIDGTVSKDPVLRFNLDLDRIPLFYFAPSGYLFFNRSGSLAVQRIDPESPSTTSRAVSITGRVGTPVFWFTLSAVGNQVVMIASESTDVTNNPGNPLARLKWFNRLCEDTGTLGPPGRFWTLRLSPDGSRVAANPGPDIWIYDSSNRSTRVTSYPGDSFSPVWSPDGKRIAFSRLSLLLVKSVALEAEEIELLNDPDRNYIPTDWHDKYILFSSQAPGESTNYDIWYYDLKEKRASPWQPTQYNEYQARFSPDGKWIAYVSDKSGLDEIYLHPFEEEKTPILVSEGGGNHPVWSHDGQELFYIKSCYELMAVDLSGLDAKGEIGDSQTLFEIPMNDLSSTHFSPYDVSRDGRFLFNMPESPEPLLFIQGLEELLQRKQ